MQKDIVSSLKIIIAMSKERDIIIEFVKNINNHSAEGLAGLMTDDHTFVDAIGTSMTGKEEMKNAWQIYFEWFPDYVINVSDIISGSNSIAMFGYASGTYKGIKNETNSYYWRLPAAWKIIVENEKIKLWQVFCDTKVPYEIMQGWK